MELISELMDVVKDAPDLAIWVIAIIFGYKALIVGSIYGVIKFCISRSSECIESVKDKNVELAKAPREIEIYSKIDGITIADCTHELINQIRRLIGVKSIGGHIHRRDVEWLEQAISEKLKRDEKHSD